MTAPAAASSNAATATTPAAPAPLPVLQLEPEVVNELSELCASLDEARQLHRAAQEYADREEAAGMVAELEQEINRALLLIAQLTRGVVDIGKLPALEAVQQMALQQQMLKPVAAGVGGGGAAAAVSLPLAAVPTKHQMLWDDGKTYACQVASLKYDSEKQTIHAVLDCVVGFPGNSERGKIEHCNLACVSMWDGLGAAGRAELLAAIAPSNAKAKVFAVGERGIFVPATIEHVGGVLDDPITTSTVVVRVLPASSNNNNNNNGGGAAVSYSDTDEERRLPLTHIRPWALPPYQGRVLRRKWANLSPAEQAEVEAERKAKKAKDAEKKRRQRSENIASEASSWASSKALLGGAKRF